MRFFTWLRNQERSDSVGSTSTHGSPLKRSTFRPQLEALEDRQMPSTYYAATASDLIADIKAANRGGANTIVLTAPTTSPYVLTAVDNTTDGPTVLPVIKKTLTIVTGNGSAKPATVTSLTPQGRGACSMSPRGA